MRHMVLLVGLAVVLAPFTSADRVFPSPKPWHIHVVNGLSNGELIVHCKSKDDDLGIQNLSLGAEFQWSFFMNFWATTLFWCNLRNPNNAEVSFESYWVEKRHEWLKTRCSDQNCIWTAKDDGIYLRNIPNNSDEKVHDWSK